MGNISKSFDMKKLARGLCRAKPVSAEENAGGCAARSPVTALDPYVYERLFLPILKTGNLPLKALDLGRIGYEDIGALGEALYDSAVFDLIDIGEMFRSIRPCVSTGRMFI
jgi:hypothetical protein